MAPIHSARTTSYLRAAVATVLILLVTGGLAASLLRQRRAERSARAAEARFRAMFEQSAVGMILVAPNGKRLIANRAFCSFVGYSESELQDMDAAAYSSPESFAATRQRMKEALQGDIESFELEKEYLHKDGRRLWGLLCATLVRDTAGSPAHFVGQVVDISARKAADLALKESEERFRVFVDNMEDVFWLATPSLDRVLYVSPAFERVFGRSIEEPQRSARGWRAWIHPEHESSVTAFVARQVQGLRAEVELQVMRPHGDSRWLLVRSVPWVRADGLVLVAGIAADITSRKCAEQERIRLAERQRDTLIKEVHHRIKNNLQGVLGLLDEHVRHWPESRGVLDVVAARVQSVATVHGLQSHHVGSAVLLDDLVESIADTLRRMTNARITFRAPAARARIAQLSDREAVPLALAINELVWNALKHSSEAPKHATITLDSDEATHIARVEIVNTVSSSEEERFGSTHSSGLGLALVKALLPPTGARLELACVSGQVRATLTLSDPVVVWTVRIPDAQAHALLRDGPAAVASS